MSGESIERLRLDYRVAFLRALPRRDEAALSAAYELGRAALSGRVGVLDLVRVHHEVLAEVLSASAADEIPQLVAVAGDFLAETLAALEFTARAVAERAGTEPAGAL